MLRASQDLEGSDVNQRCTDMGLQVKTGNADSQRRGGGTAVDFVILELVYCYSNMEQGNYVFTGKKPSQNDFEPASGLLKLRTFSSSIERDSNVVLQEFPKLIDAIKFVDGLMVLIWPFGVSR